MKKIIFLSVIIFCLTALRSFAQMEGATLVPVTGLKVGTVLTAGYTGTLGGSNTAMYEWFYSDNTALVNIGNTYTVKATDEGKMFYVKVTEVNGGGNAQSGPFQSPTTGEVNYMPVSTTPIITGTPNSGQILLASYTYSDEENDTESGSILQWYRSLTTNVSDAVPVSGANSLYYLVTSDDYNKYISFGVIPVSSAGSQTGLSAMSSFTAKVDNDAPVASFVVLAGPGTFNVNDVLVGDYTYSDTEGDQEGASAYQWIRSENNTISADDAILPVATIYYKLSLPDTGKYIFFRVTPKAVKGNLTGTPVASPVSGRVNTPPYVRSVSINGTVQVGQVLTGTYYYGDRDHDPQDLSRTIYKWYRDGNLISGASGITYVITEDDEGKKLKFQVTPVSSSGYPDTGNTGEFELATVVPASSNLPVADQLCISGVNAVDSILEGNYHYYNTSKDNRFEFRWMRDNDTIAGATLKTYRLTPSDENRNIRFVVYPISKSGLSRGITAVSDTLARILLLQDRFFATDPDIVVTGAPRGGDFFGDGIRSATDTSKFSPSSLDYTQGPFTINYQVIEVHPGHTCIQTDPKTVTITPVNTYFEGINASYCTNGVTDNIYARNIPDGLYNYRFRMTGSDAIVSQNGVTCIIDPVRMNPGINNNLLIFEANNDVYLDIPLPFPLPPIHLFLYTVTVTLYQQPLIVYQAPSIMVEGIREDQVFCSSEWEFKLKATPEGGNFSGGPIKNVDIFDPSKGSRNDFVSYSYKEPSTGCTSVRTYPVVINPAPNMGFALSDSCIVNSSDSTEFLNYTTSTDRIKSWDWKFLESGGSQSLSDSSVSFLYKRGGIHNVELIATTINNCPDTIRHSLDLGNKPVADFYWLNECFHEGGSDKLLLHDLTQSESAVKSVTWKFPNNSFITRYGAIIDTTYTYPKVDSGYIDIQYIVRTNYYNCHDTATKKIYIRPTVESIPPDGYLQNFESGKRGWVPYTLNDSIWSFGTPTNRTVINKAASGVNAWYTSYTIGKQNPGDTASIISPCFDFTGVERPMIRMLLWKQFDKDRDGAVLQYKIGDEPGWKPVGTLDEGINWFNSALIGGKPGGSNLGWTSGPGNSKDPYYVESSNKLDSLSGKKDVKFRIAYGSDGSSKNNDGIAFDSIWIGRRTRGVLVEHFTNNSSAATDQVSSLANRWTDDVINIQYHTNFPSSDPFYNLNPGDASARFVFYGLTKAPYTFIDGGTDNPNFASLFDYNLFPFDSSRINKRSLINPMFRINMTATISSGQMLHVSGTVKALRAVNAENLTLYIAVTQKKGISSGDSKQYYNIFRKFIPDAGGIPMQKNMQMNEDFSLPEQTWNYTGFNNSDMEVIVFIQNNITKIVYQAESIIQPDNLVGIDNHAQPGETEFSLWPNPSSGRLTVGFDTPLNSETDINIYDFSGTMVRTYKTSAGESGYVIDNHGLKNGIYLVRVSSGGIDRGFRKLVVSKNR